MTPKEIIKWLDKNNSLKWHSFAGTPDENRHCGLGISDKKWQEFRQTILEQEAAK